MHGKEIGPISEEDLQHIFVCGALPLSTPVWAPHLASWTTAEMHSAFKDDSASITHGPLASVKTKSRVAYFQFALGAIILTAAIIKPSNPDAKRGAEPARLSATSQETLRYWKGFRELEDAFNARLNELKHPEVPTLGGMYTFRDFNDEEFDSLQRFHEQRAVLAREHASKIAALRVADVDTDLVKHALNIARVVRARAKTDDGFWKLVGRVHIHKTKYNSPEGYTLRLAEALAGNRKLHDEEESDQRDIEGLASDCQEMAERSSREWENLMTQEEQLKLDLTGRYERDFL